MIRSIVYEFLRPSFMSTRLKIFVYELSFTKLGILHPVYQMSCSNNREKNGRRHSMDFTTKSNSIKVHLATTSKLMAVESRNYKKRKQMTVQL